MISSTTIEAVKQRANLLELIGEITPIKRVGSRYVSLCPFHSERSPSFYIRETDNSFHCFGCGVSGNVISFVMQHRGLSFPDAVEDLAARYGIEVLRENALEKRPLSGMKTKLYEVNQLAQYYFRVCYQRDERAQKYTEMRGVSQGSLGEFEVGFAPLHSPAGERKGLTSYLLQKGIDPDTMLTSGLVKKSARGDLYDTFSGRLQFPIYLDAKRIAGFGGRLIPEMYPPEQQVRAPKYLNSPETPIYHKQKILFGYPLALPTIRQKGEAYIVEGYLDVLSLHQAGVKNVVAACGTALSESHLTQLSHVAKKIIVLFDGDSAGKAAAAKSFRIFANATVDVWAVLLEEGEDPDSFAQHHGAKTEEVLKSLPRVALIDVYIDSLLERYGANSIGELGAPSKAAIAREIAAILSDVGQDLMREEYIRRAAFKLCLTTQHLYSLMNGEERSISVPSVEVRTDETRMSQVDVARKEIQALPKVDRELLYTLMGCKDTLPQKALSDSQLVSGLDPDTLTFVQGLCVIMDGGETSEEQKRAQIRTLLISFGSSWMEHWKQAYIQLNDKEVNLERSFEECCRAIKRRHMSRIISELAASIEIEPSEQEKENLVREYMSLEKMMRRLSDERGS